MGGKGRQKKRELSPEPAPRARGLSPLHRGHAERLRWHWGTREADSGLRSSHAALVEMIRVGPAVAGGDGQTGHASRLDSRRAAQAAHGRIEAALAVVTEAQRGALYLAYGPHILDGRGAERPLAWMGDAGPVSALTAAAGIAFAGAVARARRTTDRAAAAGSPEWGGACLAHKNALGRAEHAYEEAKAALAAAPADEKQAALRVMFRAMGARNRQRERAGQVVLRGAKEESASARVASLEANGVWGWLLTRSREADRALLDAVEQEARGLLRSAHEAFATAMGEKPERTRRAVTKRVQAEGFSPVWAGA